MNSYGPFEPAARNLRNYAAEDAWLIPGLIPKDGLVILASAPKVGKTCFATALARAVARGGEFLGSAAPQSAVFWCAHEESPRERVPLHEGLTEDDPFFIAYGDGLPLLDELERKVGRPRKSSLVGWSGGAGFVDRTDRTDKATRYEQACPPPAPPGAGGEVSGSDSAAGALPLPPPGAGGEVSSSDSAAGALPLPPPGAGGEVSGSDSVAGALSLPPLGAGGDVSGSDSAAGDHPPCPPSREGCSSPASAGECADKSVSAPGECADKSVGAPSGSPGAGSLALNEGVYEAVFAFAASAGARLIVIDCLHAAMGRLDLAENHSARLVMGRLRRWSLRYGIAVLVLHHLTKTTSRRNSPERFADSSQILAASSCHFFLERREAEDGSYRVTLHGRGRYPSPYARLDLVSEGPLDYRLAAEGETPATRLSTRDRLIALLGEGWTLNATELARRIEASPSTVRPILRELVDEEFIVPLESGERAARYQLRSLAELDWENEDEEEEEDEWEDEEEEDLSQLPLYDRLKKQGWDVR